MRNPFDIKEDFRDAAAARFPMPSEIVLTKDEERWREGRLNSFARLLQERDEEDRREYSSYREDEIRSGIYSADFIPAMRNLTDLMNRWRDTLTPEREDAICHVIDYVAQIYQSSTYYRQMRDMSNKPLRHEQEKHDALHYLHNAIRRIQEAQIKNPYARNLGSDYDHRSTETIRAEKTWEPSFDQLDKSRKAKIALAESVIDEVARLEELERCPPTVRPKKPTILKPSGGT
jgi:hypothetical protein